MPGKPVAKVNGKEEWDTFAILKLDRHYGMFSALGGGRQFDDIPCVIQERGFPEDAGYWTQHEHDETDGPNDPSWLDWKEYAIVLRRAAECGVKVEHLHQYRQVLTTMNALVADGYEARIVFWFDN